MPSSTESSAVSSIVASEAATAGSASSTATAPAKVVYAGHFPLAEMPTQVGPEGIRYDFNDGARVVLPERGEGAGLWRIRLTDLDTGNVVFNVDVKGARVNSTKRYYVRFRLEVWVVDADPKSKAVPRSVLDHSMDLTDQNVLIHQPPGTVGDSFAWFTYTAEFAKKHPNARVTVCLSEHIIPLVKNAYPNLIFVTQDQLREQKLVDTFYASYALGVYFADKECNHQPVDFRHVGLHKTAAYILGVDPIDVSPKLALEDESRPMAEKYVCIAVQATSAAKQWNNPYGWREVVKFLKASGYEVVCIDQKPEHGVGLRWTHIPHGTVDKTGISLMEAARYLRHCEFMVGLSSGLSWLAWAAGATVVLISGFSLPSTEFYTPYRIINWHPCNGCWNDPALVFENQNFLWCPRHANTPRQFECTTQITGTHVIRVIKTIPHFRDVREDATTAASAN